MNTRPAMPLRSQQNLDLEDLNVRNAQFKSFDTMVRMKLKPVWHRVGAKTRIHVAALTELRNLHTLANSHLITSKQLTGSWLLEYDSATFASYINGLHRQFFKAQKIQFGPGKHLHDWFNAKAAAKLVEASQGRIARRKAVMDNSPDPDSPTAADGTETSNGAPESDRFEDDEEAMRDVQMGDEDDGEIMEVFATQGQVAPTQADRSADGMITFDDGEGGEEDEPLMDIGAAPAPPVFEPMQFDMDAYLTKTVERRMKKGHEAVLEEQPKWSLLAKVLKEIEDTIARVSETHAGESLT